MAAAALRHFQTALSTTSTTSVLTVPASRALVVSKLLVAYQGGGTAATMTLYAGSGGVSSIILYSLSMNTGQVYTETGIVLLATEQILAQSNTAGVFSVHVFGEEVDN
jgi:hypothetical protein